MVTSVLAIPRPGRRGAGRGGGCAPTMFVCSSPVGPAYGTIGSRTTRTVVGCAAARRCFKIIFIVGSGQSCVINRIKKILASLMG